MSTADADRPGWRTIKNRIASDRRFLAELRAAATVEEVERIEEREIRWGAPKWRRIAIERVKRMRSTER